jgi:hypothetical protein
MPFIIVAVSQAELKNLCEMQLYHLLNDTPSLPKTAFYGAQPLSAAAQLQTEIEGCKYLDIISLIQLIDPQQSYRILEEPGMGKYFIKRKPLMVPRSLHCVSPGLRQMFETPVRPLYLEFVTKDEVFHALKMQQNQYIIADKKSLPFVIDYTIKPELLRYEACKSSLKERLYLQEINFIYRVKEEYPKDSEQFSLQQIWECEQPRTVARSPLMGFF